jgi:hypothetical protein
VSNLLTHSLKLLLINNKESLIKTIIINLDVSEELLLAEYVVPETKTPYRHQHKRYSFHKFPPMVVSFSDQLVITVRLPLLSLVVRIWMKNG